ncbi:MAG TPA: hypothetical protein VKG84_02615 [Candidatus Acidoferrales bacterium]|nr:hypothetical protein [Candidatus Acidoferrales bacterium]
MPESQTRRTVFLAALALAATALLLAVLLRAAPITHAQNAAKPEAAAGAERWLHIAVDCKSDSGERVRVNVPISLARSVLASVEHGKLNHGIVHIDNARINDIDIRAILKALKTTQDGEYVTVEQKDTTVHVRKQGEMLLIHVVDSSGRHRFHSEGKGQENVDIRVPLAVADALFSGPTDELNVTAALDLLARYAQLELVSVQDAENNVRVWMDTKTTQD